ncbi:MAG: hypothetical protein NT075_25995 [Chloroflexi bacterium]|nr:hypothetical protein [Chloroflexota bacterium]
MKSLVINAPKSQVDQGIKKSFQRTMSSGVGEGYAISKNLYDELCIDGKISSDCGVVLLSKDQKLRAEGILVKLVCAGKTKTGMQRYDVHIDELKPVTYKTESLNRMGIAIIEM